MKALRAILLGACAVAVPLAFVAANAAEPSAQAITLYDAAGRPVAILTPINAGAVRAAPSAWDLLRQADAQRAMPVADPFAQMDAMMNAMMARMNMLAAMPFSPGGAANVALPQGAEPGQMFISTFSSGGRGSCSETVTYRMDGSGAQPQVAVRRVGDACGVVAAPGTRAVPAVMPDEPAVPVQPSDQKLYKIDYRHKGAPQRPLHG
jgi:hypothetical protein